MALWSDFYTALTPELPGVPYPSLDAALLRVATDFFFRTRAWREWLSPVTVLANTRTYAIPMPTNSDVVRIEQATIDGAVLPVLSYLEFNSNLSTVDQATPGVTTIDRKNFITTMTYVAGQSVVLQASLVPGIAATGITDAQFAQYSDDICAGVKARLMLMENMPWSHPQLALKSEAEYESAVAQRNIEAWRGQTNLTPRTRVRWL